VNRKQIQLKASQMLPNSTPSHFSYGAIGARVNHVDFLLIARILSWSPFLEQVDHSYLLLQKSLGASSCFF